MNVAKQLYLSLYHLKKVSVFRIQKLGKSIGYIFFLMAIALIPQIINSLAEADGTSNNEFPMIFSFIFLYIFMTSLLFVGVSVLAGLALWSAKIQNKKLQYTHTWTLAAYAITTPTLVFSIMEAIGLEFALSWLLYLIIALAYLYGILKYIPRKKGK